MKSLLKSKQFCFLVLFFLTFSSVIAQNRFNVSANYGFFGLGILNTNSQLLESWRGNYVGNEDYAINIAYLRSMGESFSLDLGLNFGQSSFTYSNLFGDSISKGRETFNIISGGVTLSYVYRYLGRTYFQVGLGGNVAYGTFSSLDVLNKSDNVINSLDYPLIGESSLFFETRLVVNYYFKQYRHRKGVIAESRFFISTKPQLSFGFKDQNTSASFFVGLGYEFQLE